MAQKEKGFFWQRMGKSLAVMAVMTLTVVLFAEQGLAQLVWQNPSNQRTNYWVLNSNGTLKNYTKGDGWDNIATSTLNTGWYIQTIQPNGDKSGHNHLIWQNTVTGATAYWRINSTGTLKNYTRGDGTNSIHTSSISTAWRVLSISSNADSQGTDHLLWFNGNTRKPVYWALNSNGTLKNTTRGDGWNEVDSQGQVTMAVGWSAGGTQPNADFRGSNHIIWQNTNGKTAYWKLDSTGVLKNKTQGDGWDLISTFTLNPAWRMVTVQPNGDRLGNNHLIWQNTSDRKSIYWKLNSNGTLKNRTQGDGWAYIGTNNPGAGWTVSRILYNADTLGNDHLLWVNSVNGRSLYWKLNSTGAIKNYTQGDGWDNLRSNNQAPEWRIRGAHDPAAGTVQYDK